MPETGTAPPKGFDRERAQRALDHIIANPDQWDQTRYRQSQGEGEPERLCMASRIAVQAGAVWIESNLNNTGDGLFDEYVEYDPEIDTRSVAGNFQIFPARVYLDDGTAVDGTWVSHRAADLLGVPWSAACRYLFSSALGTRSIQLGIDQLAGMYPARSGVDETAEGGRH